MEDIIEPSILGEALRLSKAKNYQGCLFVLAPVTRALTDRAITTFTPKNKNKTTYFTMNFECNLNELRKRINGLDRLLTDYTDTKELLLDDMKKYDFKYNIDNLK